MEGIAFTILEHTHSEMQERGFPLLVTLRVWGSRGWTLRSFLPIDWKELIRPAHAFDLQYISDLIYDLRQLEFRGVGDREELFCSLCDISVGPLRTLSSGNYSETKKLAMQLGSDENGSVTLMPLDQFRELLNVLGS